MKNDKGNGMYIASGFNIDTTYRFTIFSESKKGVDAYPKIQLTINKPFEFAPQNYYMKDETNNIKSFYADEYYYSYRTPKQKILITPTDINLICDDESEGYVLVNAFSIGTVFASRLHHRAIQHGSAFLYKNKAYLIIADSGFGKSTLCAGMWLYQNTPIISDDVLCLSSDGNFVYNSVSAVKLTKADTENFQVKNRFNTVKIHQNQPKQVCVCDVDMTKQDEYKIGGLFFLRKHISLDKLYYKRLNSFESFCELTKNIKLRHTLSDSMLKNELKILNHIASNTPAFEISLLHNHSILPEITSQIIKIIDNT